MSTPTCGGIKKNQVYYQTEHHGTMLTVLLAPMRKKDMATRREETTRNGFTDVLFLHKVNQLVALSYREWLAPVAKPAPYGTSKTVGAVPQPKEDANVERSEVEITENLNNTGFHKNTYARSEGDFDKYDLNVIQKKLSTFQPEVQD